MKPYNTQKNKINMFNNKVEELNNRQDIQNLLNSEELKNTNLKNLTISNTKNYSNFSTEWEDFEENLEDNYHSQKYFFMIEVGIFDIRLIPYIYVTCLYRNQGGTFDDGIVLGAYLRQSINYQIEDIENEKYLKKLNIFGQMFISNNVVDSLYQAKILVGFENPRNYN